MVAFAIIVGVVAYIVFGVLTGSWLYDNTDADDSQSIAGGVFWPFVWIYWIVILLGSLVWKGINLLPYVFSFRQHAKNLLVKNRRWRIRRQKRNQVRKLYENSWRSEKEQEIQQSLDEQYEALKQLEYDLGVYQDDTLPRAIEFRQKIKDEIDQTRETIRLLEKSKKDVREYLLLLDNISIDELNIVYTEVDKVQDRAHKLIEETRNLLLAEQAARQETDTSEQIQQHAG